MGQSLVKNYIHIIFSTKQRVPLIHQPVEEELYSYMYGTEVYSALSGLEFVHDLLHRASPCVGIFRSFRALIFDQIKKSKINKLEFFRDLYSIILYESPEGAKYINPGR